MQSGVIPTTSIRTTEDLHSKQKQQRTLQKEEK